MNEPQGPAPSGAPKEDLPRLYSLNSIGFSTFFGSMPAQTAPARAAAGAVLACVLATVAIGVAHVVHVFHRTNFLILDLVEKLLRLRVKT